MAEQKETISAMLRCFRTTLSAMVFCFPTMAFSGQAGNYDLSSNDIVENGIVLASWFNPQEVKFDYYYQGTLLVKFREESWICKLSLEAGWEASCFNKR